MKCCVPGCKNDSRNVSKSQGVTFHVFPNEPSLRTAWLRAVAKEQWEPKERSAVCSEHFLGEDLYETKSGLRKVRTGAVPFIIQDSFSCDYGDTTSSRVCRMCLVMDSKFFSIKEYKLEQAFTNLTGFISDNKKLPQQVCVECAQRLVTCDKFRVRSLQAHSLLLEILKTHDHITLQNIKAINRENNNLCSSLLSKHYPVDYYDYQLEYNENETQTDNSGDIQSHDIAIHVKIKEETNNEIFLNESDYNQDIKDESIHNHNDNTNNHNANDFNDNTDNVDDVDFVISDKEYSTDDSLPLERRRTKKKELKKKGKLKEVKVRKKKTVKEPAEPKIDRRRKPFLNEDLNETLFAIADLSYDEQMAEILKRQETSNYKNSVFKCTACFKGFLDEDAYNSHMIKHTDQCGEYECNVCKTHFKHPHALRKHITAHHTQRFSCNQCPYVTTHRQTARLHERWHKGTKYQCPHCQDEFVKFTTYMGHIRIKHPSDFVCELCGYSFVSEKGIELHKKLKHRLDNVEIPDDGPYCELCNVRFVSLEAHRKHIQVSARHTDSEKKPKESNKAKKPRKERDSREKGSRDRRSRESGESSKRYPSQLRKAEGPIPCEQCGLQLEDSRAYHGHFRRMHPDKNRTNYPSMKSPCMCEVCGRMFQSYALLKDHTWVHTGERPFKCENCGKSFRMKQRLVAHRRIHSQEKASYVCPMCGKHFSTHSNRQRHMFIHTGLKPFKCEMCGKCFKHASEKRAHITYVHLKKPWPKRSRGKRRQDSRQMPPQPSLPTSGSEMDIVQPIWPCDPKLGDINSIMDDKPMYYNLKI